MVENIIFLIFVLLTVCSAAMVVFTPKPIHSAFSLLFTLFGVAGLYVFLGADFLAGAQVMVYVGGVLVLIIFGIMLTRRITDVKMSEVFNNHWLAGASGILLLFISLVVMIYKTPWKTIYEPNLTPTTSVIGGLLLTRYLLPFEIASVLLLVAALGAVIIVRKDLKQ